jgi:hypothetical protein
LLSPSGAGAPAGARSVDGVAHRAESATQLVHLLCAQRDQGLPPDGQGPNCQRDRLGLAPAALTNGPLGTVAGDCSEQRVDVKGFGQILIGAKGERRDLARFIGHLGQRDNRDVTSATLGTNSLAQL